MSTALAPHVLSTLPSSVWRADASPLPADDLETVASTYPALDAVLPGGGWPLGQLTELLSQQPVGADWQLVLPALVAHQQAATGAGQARWAGSVVLVNPVHTPFAPVWQSWGVDTQRLVCLRPPSPQAAAWAVEQALRCADVVAVLAWLPHASAVVLRRLQYAASHSRSLTWVLRPASAAAQASPAPLRVQADAAVAADGEPSLRVRVLKRRGAPHEQDLLLPWAQDAVVQAWRAARDWRQAWSPVDRAASQENSDASPALDAVDVAAV